MQEVRRNVRGHRGRMFQSEYRVSAASQKLRGSRWPLLSCQQGPSAEGVVTLLWLARGIRVALRDGRPEAAGPKGGGEHYANKRK